MSIKTMNLTSVIQLVEKMCGKRIKRYPFSRAPNEVEISEGVPEWFTVQVMDKHSKIYKSLCGEEFLSVSELQEWRKNLTFEDVDWSIPSF